MSRLLKIVPLRTLGCTYLFWIRFHFSLSVMGGSYGGSTSGFLRNLHTAFHSCLHQFTFPPIVYKGFLFFTSSLTFVIGKIIGHFPIVTGMKWQFIIVLIYISLIISNIEHLFMCLLPICMSSLENGYSVLSPSFDLVVCFWYLVVWAVYVLWILFPCWSHHLQIILSHSVGLFIFSVISFATQKLLTLIRSHLFWLFVCFCFDLLP